MEKTSTKKLEESEILHKNEEPKVLLKKSIIETKPKVTKEKKQASVLDLPGVGAATAEKLQNSGYGELLSIAVSSPGQIMEVTGLTESATRKIISFARNSLDMGFESGSDMLQKRLSVNRISTGSDSFDKLMNGGFESGVITECFGEYGSGKTQIGHLLIINAIKNNPDKMAIYIDTENTFRPERLIQLAEGAGLDPDEVLKKVKIARAYNSDHQLLLAEKVEEMLKHKEVEASILVIDSLISHFRAEFIGRGTLAGRQQKLNKHMHKLLKIADVYNMVVYVTNQVMSKPDTFFGDPTQAIGGHVVAHSSAFRIYLRKGKKGSRVAKLVDSPNLPDGECNFFVETRGLRDA